MKRSVFFLITALLSIIVGGISIFMTSKASAGLGMGSSPETLALMRAMGGIFLSMGILNFLIKDNVDSKSLRDILVFNIVVHLSGMLIDFWAINEKTFTLNKTLPGHIFHLFVIIGSIIFLQRMGNYAVKKI